MFMRDCDEVASAIDVTKSLALLNSEEFPPDATVLASSRSINFTEGFGGKKLIFLDNYVFVLHLITSLLWRRM